MRHATIPTLLNCMVVVAILLTCGCFQSKPAVETQAMPSAAGENDSSAAAPRETLNKTTQNVLDLEKAIADGAVLAETKASATDPLLQSAAAYRTTVGKLGAMAVFQAIQIRDAQSINDPKPLSHEELIKDIIQPGQPGGIQLPMLPYYQEYAWDRSQQKLVVVDFPARKEDRQKQLDSN